MNYFFCVISRTEAVKVLGEQVLKMFHELNQNAKKVQSQLVDQSEVYPSDLDNWITMCNYLNLESPTSQIFLKCKC